MSLQLYLAYVAACFALVIVPGPVVTLIIANGLRHGTRAALINIAGAQAGLALAIGIVAFGLTTLMATAGYWFDWLRIAGAIYLAWLGIKIFATADLASASDAPALPPRGGFFLQGLVVLLSNPKMLVFFGAFIPQFIDINSDHLSQVIVLGATFMAVAGISDAVYAVLAGRARAGLSARRAQMVSRTSGVLMIGGGLWLALSRTR